MKNKLGYNGLWRVVWTIVGSFFVFGPMSANAQDPAVSGVNGKFGVQAGYGQINGDSKAKGAVVFGDGSIAFPIGQLFGGQIDGVGGLFAGRTFSSIGGHLFWRDPKIGQLYT